MKIKRIIIKKFRSIESMDVRIGDVTALVGPNNVGKSSLLRALNSFFNLDAERSFFYNNSHEYSARSHTKIRLTFGNLPDNPTISQMAFNGELTLELKFLPRTKNFSLSFLNPNQNPLDIGFLTEIKKYVDFVFIPPARSHDELLWQEEKAIKRVVLALLEDKFKTRDTVTPLFSKATDYLQKNALKSIEKKLTEYYGDRSAFDFELRFRQGLSFLDFLGDLDFRVRENGKYHSVADCGSGVQSLSIIALYRLLASLNHTNIIIGVEEPETNLHPQSQKQLVKRVLSPSASKGESQVLFTTHSTVLIDALSHSDILLFKKHKDLVRGFNTSVTQVRENFWAHYNIEELKYYKFHNYSNSDFFFSRLVILVESTNDAEILKQLLLQKDVDVDDYPVSVINVDGVDSLKYPLFLLRELRIPDMIIVDKDFFVPYANDSLEQSRYESGFPKYGSEFKEKNKHLIDFLIDKTTDQTKLLALLKANHSRALDLLEEYNIISMKHSLEVDLIASDRGAELYYEKLQVPADQRNKRTLLVDRKKQIKQLENLKYVVENLPHQNLPNSYKRIKKFVSKKIKQSIY